jgi:bacterioferritin-associated ferredoxin
LVLTFLKLKAMFNFKRQAGMYVCLCVGVTDRVIKELARNGACPDEVSACTGAGTRCGTCVSTIKSIVQEAQSVPESRRRLDVVKLPAVTAA